MNDTSGNDIKRIRNRVRTNILHKPEFAVIEFFCKIMPKWMTPDMLTGIGFIGSLLTCAGILLARGDKYYLILSCFGLALQWWGDSLDGRIAYYRNTPRKWYGWVLDMNLDWISTGMMALSILFYLPQHQQFAAFLFMATYGHAYILALMRYKITGIFVIDPGIFGPTETRILLGASLFSEIFITNFLFWFGIGGSILLVIINSIDLMKVLKLGDQRDIEERKAKAETNA